MRSAQNLRTLAWHWQVEIEEGDPGDQDHLEAGINQDQPPQQDAETEAPFLHPGVLGFGSCPCHVDIVGVKMVVHHG